MLVTGAEIVDVAQGSVVDKQGATHGPFDLVVVADGAHSALRARLMPGARAPVYPWGCIWTTVPDLAGLGAAGLLRQRVHGTTVMMGLLPVGQGQMTMFWSLPVEALAADRTIDLVGLAPRGSGDCGPRPPRSSITQPQPATSRARPIVMSRCRAGTRVRCCSSAMPRTAPARSSGQGANLGLLDAHALFCALSRERRPRRRRWHCSPSAAARPCASTARPATC